LNRRDAMSAEKTAGVKILLEMHDSGFLHCKLAKTQADNKSRVAQSTGGGAGRISLRKARCSSGYAPETPKA